MSDQLPDALSRLRRSLADPDAPPDSAAPPRSEPPAEVSDAPASSTPIAEPVPVTPPPVAKPESPPAVGRSGRVIVAVLALLAVAAAAVVAVGVQRLADRHRSHAKESAVINAQDQIVASATSEVESALSYDYRHLSQDFANAEQGLTPSYRAAYGRFTGQDVVANAQKYHAVTTAAVEGVGVISNTTRTATLLVFINQTSTNSLLKSPRLDRSSARITMQKLNGKWLLNGLNTV